MNNTNLHVYFHTWNVTGFKRYLEAGEIPGLEGGLGGVNGSQNEARHGGKGGKSSSGPRSWTLSSLSHLPRKPDPNLKDGLGRTVLHLVCSSGNDPRSFDFLQILLAHPHIQVNAQDTESGWTALHRAMWTGNLRAARELLQRADTDLGVKDAEGLTAMDLYNSTCEGTNPEENAKGTDLFTWGSNKNYTLGLPDPSDRALPERVNLLTQSQAAAEQAHSGRDGRLTPSKTIDHKLRLVESSKFDQTGVYDVAMAKWHTAVITTENRGNLSLAGFGSTGRLGKTVHSQYALRPHTDLAQTIVAVALGQDHTLVLNSHGHVMTWGQNRFSQLGYIIEGPGGGESVHKAFSGSSTGEELFQTSPKRVLGPLKKEVVEGVAASRMSSACWTSDAVWTWGTNTGHLGYEKSSNPVQILPRKATAVTTPVLDLALTDYAMACLLENHEVLVLHADSAIKITFPNQRFPSEFMVYRPPAFVARPNITKITSSGITFAALSSLGDVFTFSLPNPVDVDVSRDGKDKHLTIKPQMVWALRKRFTAVKDVALGSDGAVIICTHSGHVFVRQRIAKQWSFRRIPFLQRVIRVSANETGSFAAIRSDARPSKLSVHGSTLPEDMLDLLPHMQRFSHIRKRLMAGQFDRKSDEEEDEDDETDEAVLRDAVIIRGLGHTIVDWKSTDEDLTLGCDIYLATEDRHIPAHSFMLTQRLPPLKAVWQQDDPRNINHRIKMTHRDGIPVLDLSKFSLWSVLLLLQYVYSDELTAVWDSRVQSSLKAYIPAMQVDIIRIRQDLGELADIYGLETWKAPLASTGKVAMFPTLPKQLATFYDEAQQPGSQPYHLCDVILKLADKEVLGHSLLLRARCPFFDAMYQDSEWTATRRDEDGLGHIIVDLPNMKWSSTRMVLRYLHDGAEDNIFDYDHQSNLDDFLDFVFEVMSVANELLLDRMVLLCSAVIRRHVAISNASTLACEASFYHAQDLKISIFSYIAANLETMLENGMLDQMDIRVLYDLASFVQEKQGLRLPITRSNVLLEMAMEKNALWLEMQDLPIPRLRAPRQWKVRSPRIQPTVVETTRQKERPRTISLEAPTLDNSRDDDIFAMEDDLPSSITSNSVKAAPFVSAADSSGSIASPWRSKTLEPQKVDLRSIMAETSHEIKQSSAIPLRTPSRPSPQVRHSEIPQSLSPGARGTSIRSSAIAQLDLRRASPGASSPITPQQANRARPESPSPSAFPSLGQPSKTTTSARMPSFTGGQAAMVSAQAGPSKRPHVFSPSPRIAKGSRNASEPAWAIPTLSAPALASPLLSPPTGAISLLNIQQQESHAKNLRSSQEAAPRSLLEIQRAEAEAAAQEAEALQFERWFNEEAARVQAAGAGSAKKKARPPRGRAKKPGAEGKGNASGTSKPIVIGAKGQQ